MKYSTILISFSLILVFGCNISYHAELEQGAQVIGYMLSPFRLRNSSYAALYPNGKPSDFVSFIFSDIGVAEWPESEAMAEEDPMILEQARAIRAPLIPKGVALVPLFPNPRLGKQVVVRFDDEAGLVIAEGYLDPTQKPVLIRKWKLPKVEPAAGIEEMAQGQSQLGMSDRSF